MAFVVIKDEPLDPASIRLLCTVTQVSRTDSLADLVEQSGFRLTGRRRNGFGILHGDLPLVMAVLESPTRWKSPSNKEPDPFGQTNPSDSESGSRPQSDLCLGRSFTPKQGQLPCSFLPYLSANSLDESDGNSLQRDHGEREPATRTAWIR